MLQQAMGGHALAHERRGAARLQCTFIPFIVTAQYLRTFIKSADAAQQAAYVERILQEIAFCKKDAVYGKISGRRGVFGGGTPGISTEDRDRPHHQTVSRAFL